MAVRLDMTISLDGYVAGPDDGPDEPMGRGGFRLFDWLGRGRRLFDGLPAGHVELDLVRRLETSDTEELRHRVTHLRYRVVTPSRR